MAKKETNFKKQYFWLFVALALIVGLVIGFLTTNIATTGESIFMPRKMESISINDNMIYSDRDFLEHAPQMSDIINSKLRIIRSKNIYSQINDVNLLDEVISVSSGGEVIGPNWELMSFSGMNLDYDTCLSFNQNENNLYDYSEQNGIPSYWLEQACLNNFGSRYCADLWVHSEFERNSISSPSGDCSCMESWNTIRSVSCGGDLWGDEGEDWFEYKLNCNDGDGSGFTYTYAEGDLPSGELWVNEQDKEFGDTGDCSDFSKNFMK